MDEYRNFKQMKTDNKLRDCISKATDLWKGDNFQNNNRQLHNNTVTSLGTKGFNFSMQSQNSTVPIYHRMIFDPPFHYFKQQTYACNCYSELRFILVHKSYEF